MAEKVLSKANAEVKAFRIVLITFITLYGAIAILSFGAISLAAVFSLSMFWIHGGAFFNQVLTGLIYFLIGREIFKLIALITRGETFFSESPRRIRRIAQLIFGLAFIRAIGTTIMLSIPPGEMITIIVFRALYAGMGTVLLGFGFLVIAKVIEAGVKLQQDQNLTI